MYDAARRLASEDTQLVMTMTASMRERGGEVGGIGVRVRNGGDEVDDAMAMPSGKKGSGEFGFCGTTNEEGKGNHEKGLGN